MVGATPSAAALSETRTDAELIAEIAPAMLKRLRREGVRTVLMLQFLMVGLQVSFSALWSHVGWIPWNWTPVTVVTFLGSGAFATLLFYKMIVGAPLNYELRYRRQHGKWRWEH
jgi:hypothetical protein